MNERDDWERIVRELPGGATCAVCWVPLTPENVMRVDVAEQHVAPWEDLPVEKIFELVCDKCFGVERPAKEE